MRLAECATAACCGCARLRRWEFRIPSVTGEPLRRSTSLNAHGVGNRVRNREAWNWGRIGDNRRALLARLGRPASNKGEWHEATWELAEGGTWGARDDFRCGSVGRGSSAGNRAGWRGAGPDPGRHWEALVRFGNSGGERSGRQGRNENG